ncbi:MAG: replicative DNA helicase, partial [Erysipelothrix sp.]|nr:replicative DNA helicase [Erysipelothrix sp.]
GLQKGDLILLAARPSMGKTAFALNIAMNSAILSKKAIALFSLEMPAEHLIQRMLAAKSMVKSDHLRTGNMSNNDWNALHEAANDLRQTKIFIDDSATIRMAEIFSKCRKLAADHTLGMVVIDYIQLISSTGHSDNRQQEVSLISRQLKGLARELDVPVIALSQLSRRVEQRDNKRPILSDLRESGSLEQDADIVMFLYRSEYYNMAKDGEEQTQPNIVEPVEVLISKHRNGATGTVNLQFQSNINKFFESTKRSE